jgi:ABC-2 type transport system permease protein
MRKSLIITANDLALLRRDPIPPILLLFMPLVVMAFLKPAFAPVLRFAGYADANGAEQVVPGVTVMFAYFVVGFSGAYFFREHIWGTWDRVRASELSNAQILVGKLTPALGLVLVQQAVLFAGGMALFDLRSAGPLTAVAVVALAFCLFIVAFTFFAVAVCRTVQQVFAITTLGAIMLGAIGGAITPIDAMPEWAKTIAPLTPTYWAMKGFNRVLLDGADVAGVAKPVAVLGIMALVLAAVAATRFSFDDAKTGTL